MKSKFLIAMLLLVSQGSIVRADSLFVKVSTNKAVIWHKNVESNCASKFAFDIAVSHDSITAVEFDTSGHFANCMCTFDLNVTVENLFGSYVAAVYRREFKIYHYPKDTTYLIGWVAFTIDSVNMLPWFGFTGYQSPCGGAPVGVERKVYSAPEIARVLNHPNPFNSTTNFQFATSNFQFVSLRLYDLLGREIAVLINNTMSPGEHSVQWNAANYPSGVYLYRLTTGDRLQVGKMNYIK